jgi:hypothetical protein
LPCILAHADKSLELATMQLECEDLASTTRAPPRSGVQTTAVLHVNGSLNELRLAGASYLVAARGSGFCLVDQLLPWEMFEGGFFTTDFHDHWDTTPSAIHFDVRAHRKLHIPLDGSELEQGVSDVNAENCESLGYEVEAGHFRRLRQTTKAGPCAKRAR